MPRLFQSSSTRLSDALVRLVLRRPIASMLAMVTVVVTASYWHFSQVTDFMSNQNAAEHAAIYSDALETFQNQYASEIVSRAKAHGMTVTHDYKDRPNAIPYPATFTMELGRVLGDESTAETVRLYSDYPFQWRVGEVQQDEWERKALQVLAADPTHPYYSIDTSNGRDVMRHGTAVIMSQSCVDCHNSHPASTKTDWVVGDFRGVREVILPMQRAESLARNEFLGTFLLIGVLTTTFICVLGMLIARLRRESTELERAVEERTAELAERTQALEAEMSDRQHAERERETLQHKLIAASRVAGKAEVASSVLHNVGNVLTSVNTSAEELRRRIEQLSVTNLDRVADLVIDHSDDLGSFVNEDPRGKHLPDFLKKTGEHLTSDRDAMLKEIGELTSRVDHIKHVIHMQQDNARSSVMIESLGPKDLIQQALQMKLESLDRHAVTVRHRIEPMEVIWTDRNLVLQILVNLISNAKDAVALLPRAEREIRVVAGIRSSFLCVAITDNGVGISETDRTRLFRHGFTTKDDGNGFGLHSAAIAAKQLGGRLLVQSDGPGKGATFTLEIPVDSRTRKTTHEETEANAA